MIEITPGLWKFIGEGGRHPSAVYLQDEEIIGAIIEDKRELNPRLIILTRSSGPIRLDWQAHSKQLAEYIERNNNARETD